MEDQKIKKRKVLVISSISPDKSANLGLDVRDSLVAAGYEVDFLTRYKSDIPGVISVQKKFDPKPTANPFVRRTSLFKKIFRRIFPKKQTKEVSRNPFMVARADESHPPVDPRCITHPITGKYDFAITLFWQGLLTTASLESIYHKIKVPIFILAVDMSPFTGGCFYFWDCRRFIQAACGRCPGLDVRQERDATRRNFLFKQQVYSKIPCVFLGNKWMNSYIEQTPVISGRPVREIPIVVNENVFCPRECESVARDFNMEMGEGQFILFAGAPSLHEKRKGFTYLVEAVNLFAAALPEQERSRVKLFVAGHTQEDLQSYFNVPVHQLGFLDYRQLAKAYNLAQVYVSPSIEDAGPSMVNQSVLSGTPVVAFHIGIAGELVVTGQTGYLAKVRDAADFAAGIQMIYRLSPHERRAVRQNCRELGLATCSFGVFANKIKQYDREFCREID